MKNFLYLLIITILVSSTCTRIEELQYGEVRQITIYTSDVHAAFPDAVRLKSGELLVVFREGSSRISCDGKILLSRSDGKGRSWSEPDTIVSTPWDCRTPSIVQLTDGQIIVNFYQLRYGDSGKIVGSAGCFTVRSFDNGRNFTAPRMVTDLPLDWSATSDQILEIEDGSLIMALYGHNQGMRSSVWAVISRDSGESWKEHYLIARDEDGRIDFTEPSLSILPDGRIVCMMNGGDYLYQTFSEDGGIQWSRPQVSGIEGSECDLDITQDGIVVCAYRDFWPRGVSYRLSYDWTATWKDEKYLFTAAHDWGSPDIIIMDEGVLIVHHQTLKKDHGSIIGGSLFIVRKPEVVEGFTASVASEGCVNLRWNPVKDAAYYIIYRDTVEDFTPVVGPPDQGNVVATPISCQYSDTEVDTGRVYFYRVSAVIGSTRPVSGTGCEGEPTRSIRVEIK